MRLPRGTDGFAQRAGAGINGRAAESLVCEKGGDVVALGAFLGFAKLDAFESLGVASLACEV